jgi:Xaa-Pro aminopeptidase
MAHRFQSFDDHSDRTATPSRLAALRAELARCGLDGFIITRTDRHQSEYVPASEERLAWLTAFTGSAGAAIVFAGRAVIFVDGRYTLQVAEQVDGSLFEFAHLVELPPDKWIEANVPAGTRLGYDPWLATVDGAERLAKACAHAGATLVTVDTNPVDAVWSDRPAEPLAPVVLHDEKYAGETASAKLARLQAEIAKLKVDGLVVSDPHGLCWLFNIRGGDVAHTPIALGFALVPKEGRPLLHMDGRKLGNSVRAALLGLAELREPRDFASDLSAFAAGHTLRLDQATGADALARLITGAGGKVARGSDPITAMKAAKNAAEIAGTRTAHRRDGAALTRFLAWFDRTAPGGTLTEISATEALEDFRAATGVLKDVSFPSISGAGPNGAIVHYRVNRKTDRAIRAGELFLIDSGAQYEDGTTDVTRTIAVGTPTEEMRERFTRVLKGHIAIARAVFPSGTTGAQLDSFARAPLWQAGLDFDHGTGHGVGSYLSVHEGPARISKLGHAPLAAGMILSNEPGYYKTGAYGIRIENLVLVTEAAPVEGGEKPLYAFETLTLAPFDRRLIVPAMLTEEERDWVDAYHARVRDTLAPMLTGDDADWLIQATAPLSLT